MDAESIKARNEKLLAEDEQKIAHGHRDLESQIPAARVPAIQRTPCTPYFTQFAIPLSCLFFVVLCGAGGVYCKQTRSCLYHDDSNSAPTNGTATNSSLSFHRSMTPYNNVMPLYTTPQKNLLHLIKNKRGRATKR